MTVNARTVAVTVGAFSLLLAGCGSGSSADSAGEHDSFGDPYITDAQGAAIQMGTSDTAAFAALGGKAVSGSTGDQAPPPHGYEYPVKGTGNPDDGHGHQDDLVGDLHRVRPRD